ncbi:MAG: SpoIVB peptidase [Clostridia bacterium]|nr:SpoIVB peptidase [Clostridia bacterium]
MGKKNQGIKKSRLSCALLLLLCVAAIFTGVCDYMVPSRISVRAASDAVRLAPGISLHTEEALPAMETVGSLGGDVITVGAEAKLFGVLPLKAVDVSIYRDVKLIPGGMPFGVRLYCDGVLVVDVGDVPCGGGTVSPARDAGIHAKDMITEINGQRITSVDEVVSAVTASNGQALTLTVRRSGNDQTLTIQPVQSDEDGKYKTGLWIRDSTAGIGTVTYIDGETGCFAGLGHGICDADTGELLPLSRGTIVNVSISGVVKGQAGLPGELKGYFSSGKIGTLLGNTECGVHGIFAELPAGICSQAIPIALADEVCEGDAELWCTTDSGGVGRYKVRISNIDRSGRSVKNYVVTVTDPMLLEKTGGIVQGMSGSPLVQNGRLIGAVTHVLISDPAKGYGIFIENMLNAAA